MNPWWLLLIIPGAIVATLAACAAWFIHAFKDMWQ